MIDDVVKNLRAEFAAEGLEETVLLELQKVTIPGGDYMLISRSFGRISSNNPLPLAMGL